MKHAKRIGWMLAMALALTGCRTLPPLAPPVRQETVWLRSRALRDVSYDYHRHQLELSFPNGAAYAYADVPERLYSGLKSAEYPGRYFHRYIRPRYEGILVRAPDPVGLVDD